MPGLFGFANRCGSCDPGVGLGGFGWGAAGSLKAGNPLLKAPDADVGGGHAASRMAACGVHFSSGVAMSTIRA